MKVFISGGTGYLGQRLIHLLLHRGHAVKALARPGSEAKLPTGCAPITGNALDSSSFTGQIAPADVFVHLVGVSHPAPWKEREFRAVDLASVKVAQPAPVMRAYIRVRAECEAIIVDSGLNTNILRPWYVLGPGHRWPVILLPLYRLFERMPSTRETATRLGLVTLPEMTKALAWAVENPPQGSRVISVPEIRSAAARLDREAAAGAAAPPIAGR